MSELITLVLEERESALRDAITADLYGGMVWVSYGDANTGALGATESTLNDTSLL